MASPFMCMNVASGSVDAVSLFGICLSEELFLCRFQQVVNVCNVVIVLEEIGEFVQCLALLRSNILKFGVRNSLEASGNELVLLLLDEYFRVVVVIAEIKLELIHIDTFLVLDSEYALVVEHEAIRDSDDLYYVGSLGYYWGSALFPDNPLGAYGMLFDSGYFERYYCRFYGLSVRPVSE